MTTRTTEEVKQHYIEVMGEPLGSLFHSLYQEVVWLSYQWREWEEMFGVKRSRIDLLNQAAPAFFRAVQDTLWEHMLLHIARLTDPAESFGKKNLTILQLAPLIADDLLARDIQTRVEKAMEAARFCRDWRNRRIAHRDMSLLLDQHAKPLAQATREKVDISLAAIIDVLNAVEQHYTQSTTLFRPVSTGGAIALLHVIDDGLRVDRERRERWKRGEFNADDLPSRDI